MTVALRRATPADLVTLLPRTRALNDHESIEVETEALEAALRKLLANKDLGGAWIIEDAGTAVGYAIVTFGFDLEFGGRDAWLTELWVDEPTRGSGIGAAVLPLLEEALRGEGVGAYHLQVRPDNPALRLYERHGFSRSPRLLMTRRL